MHRNKHEKVVDENEIVNPVPEFGIVVSVESFRESFEKDPKFSPGTVVNLSDGKNMSNIVKTPGQVFTGKLPAWATHVVYFNN